MQLLKQCTQQDFHHLPYLHLLNYKFCKANNKSYKSNVLFELNSSIFLLLETFLNDIP